MLRSKWKSRTQLFKTTFIQSSETATSHNLKYQQLGLQWAIKQVTGDYEDKEEQNNYRKYDSKEPSYNELWF